MHADASNAGALATDADTRSAETGELRLVAAVLERAVLDARAGCADAAAWLASDAIGAAGRGWSYLEVCAVLGLDPACGRALVAHGVRSRRPSMRLTRRLRAAA